MVKSRVPEINSRVGLVPSSFPNLAHLVGTVEGINYAEDLVSVSFFDERTGALEVIEVPSAFLVVLSPTHEWEVEG